MKAIIGFVMAGVVGALALAWPDCASAQKRVALVIGNSAYKHTNALANPRNDAADMTAALKQLGFKVIDGYDLDKAAFDKKVKEFAGALSGMDVGVFFYAGHGLQVDGQNYLVPTDAELDTAAALDFEMVRFDLVQRVMERETQTNVLFVDACRNNPLARNLTRALGTRSASIGKGLAAAEAGSGTLISFSTQPGSVASDGAGRNSPYTGPLVKHLMSSNDDLNSVLIAVRNDVMRVTERAQVPWEHSALTKRVFLNASSAGQGQAAASQSEAANAWSAIKQSRNIPALEGFVERYNNTVYADLARARLDKLKRPATPVSLASLDAIARDSQAKTLREEVLTIPAPEEGAQNAGSSSDIFVPSRGFFSIDFSVQTEAKLELVVLSEQQRNQLSTGKTLTGEPLMKVEIEGTASQTVALERGTYMIAVLNREPVPVQIAFRATFRGY
jgi:uncharacterized caspase-like protein